MTREESYEVLALLEKGVMCTTGEEKFTEPGVATNIHAYRNGAAVTITIIDHGPQSQNPQYRYFVVARMEDDPKRNATGHGGPTLEEALERVRWRQLDREI